MAKDGPTFSSDDIVVKSPNDRRLYRLVKLENGLRALLVHDPEIYPESPPKAARSDDEEEEEEEEGEEDDDDPEDEDEDEEGDEDDFEDDDDENEAEEDKGASQTKKVRYCFDWLMGFLG